MTAPCEPVTNSHKNNGKQQFLPGLLDTSTMVAESVAYLRAHEPEEGYFVGFSGGKDSIVTHALCEMAGVKFTAFYSCTRIDPPEVVRFIRREYPGVQFLMPEMTFWDGVRKWAPPLRMQRWCCTALKKKPAQAVPLKKRVMGIRAEESVRRAARQRMETFGGQTHVKAIFSWKEFHIWEFIDTHGLAYPSLYDEGFHRIGCVICPFALGTNPGAVKQRRMSQKRWPGMWRAFRASCEDYFNGGYQERKKVEYTNFDAYYAAYLRGFE